MRKATAMSPRVRLKDGGIDSSSDPRNRPTDGPRRKRSEPATGTTESQSPVGAAEYPSDTATTSLVAHARPCTPALEIPRRGISMKVAFYVRVASPIEVEDGSSLARQVSELTAWANREGHQIVQTYQDLGASGNDARRPELCRMMADATSPERPFDAVAVTSLSKFFRDPFSLINYEKRLRRVRVKLVSITPPRDDEAGQLIRQILASFDDYVSRGRSRSVRRAVPSGSAAEAIHRDAVWRSTQGGARNEDLAQPKKESSS